LRISAKQVTLRWRPALRQADGFDNRRFTAQMRQYLLNHQRIFDAYMDPSRFARHIFVRDKVKVAGIYPACSCEPIVAGLDEFRPS
jgi:hypothetical protein